MRAAAAAGGAGAGAERAQKELKHTLGRLVAKEDLTQDEAQAALACVLAGAPSEQTAALLMLLQAKGETPSEVAGLAAAMREEMVKVECADADRLLDIVGTGGDNIGSVNISTGSCVIAAAAGAKVAKHGSRSVSSLCGSADVLEAIGVNVDLGPEEIARCVDRAGVAFMFAQRYHPAMKYVAPVRKALGLRTAFNLLGPMLNPARTPYALIGVWGTEVSRLMADSVLRLGTKKALIVHSMGLDELTPMGPADVLEVSEDSVREYQITPAELGIQTCDVADLKGGDRDTNAAILKDVLGGAKGPIADALIMNAGVAIAACGVAKDPYEGVAMAREAHASGASAKTLQDWIDVSQELGAASK